MCRKPLRDAHQSALWVQPGRAARGASSCSPSEASGRRGPTGLMRAFERQATQAVTTAARNQRPISP